MLKKLRYDFVKSKKAIIFFKCNVWNNTQNHSSSLMEKKRTYGKLHLGMTLNKSTSYSLNSFGHLLFLSHCHFKSIHSPRLFSWPPTRFNQMTNGHVHLEETRIVRLQGQNLQQNWIIKPISALNPPPKKSKTSIRYCRGWVLVW